MRPLPLFRLGIKRWQDARPNDPVERLDGGDFAAFAAFHGKSDFEAGARLMCTVQMAYRRLLRGDVAGAIYFLEYAGDD